MIVVPSEVRNKLVDALERAQSPPALYGITRSTRLVVERDYRIIAAALEAIDGWMRANAK